jgi:NADH-quinone oxidoreductase subunit M
MKLTLYLLFGSAFILVGILALYVAGDSSSFSFLEMELTQFDPKLQSWVFLAFYVGFGILAGIWPLHTWSPDGHASAPTAVSMLHAGVLMKLGAYGVVRLGMGLLPDGTLQWSWLVGTIACINIVYGALSAMAQTDLKYVIAYSSVSHMGVVMLGAATLTEVGLNGSVYQMFAHGVMTGLFFALVGLVYEKAHSREIFKMGGFARSMPGIATAFTIAGLSSLGLPGTAGFVAEFLTFLGAWQSSHSWWLFPAVIGAYLTAIYVLRVTKQIFWGPPSPDPHFQHLPDARGPEWAALWILVAVIVLFGIWPALALAPVDTATMPLLNRLWVLQ